MDQDEYGFEMPSRKPSVKIIPQPQRAASSYSAIQHTIDNDIARSALDQLSFSDQGFALVSTLRDDIRMNFKLEWCNKSFENTILDHNLEIELSLNNKIFQIYHCQEVTK